MSDHNSPIVEMLKKHQQTLEELNQSMSTLLTQADMAENFLPTFESVTSSIHDLASKINYLAINTAIMTEQAHIKNEGFQVIAKEMQSLGEQTEFALEQMQKNMRTLSIILKHQTEKLHENQATMNKLLETLAPLNQELNKQ